jgi:hypothetical protein
MKNYLAGLLFILVIVSCTSKKEKEHDEVESKRITIGPIGVNNNGEYRIIGIDTISQKWSAQLKESFRLSDGVSFSEFKIVKTATQGDAVTDAYLLLTHTADNRSSIATILDLKEDGFYFYVTSRNEAVASQVIMCNSINEGQDCMPVIILHNNEKKLICPSDSDCEKTVVEISL